MSPGHEPRSQRPSFERCALVLLTLAAVVGYVALARARFIDADEGFFAYAAKLVLQGQTPYRDFFYQQMPLLPYVYGLWFALSETSLLVARYFNVLLIVCQATLIYCILRRELQNRLYAFAGALLFYGLSSVCVWHTVVKTHALSSTLLLLTYFLWKSIPNASGRRQLLCALGSGLCLGLAASTRLMFIATFPAFALDALFSTAHAGRRGVILAVFAGGVAGGLLLPVTLFALAPEAFLFDNIGYHAVRSTGGLIGDLEQKREVALALIGLGGEPDVNAWQNILLGLPMLVALAGDIARRRFPLAFALVALLSLANFMPTPTFPQYFSVNAPLLVCLALSGIAELSRLCPERTRLWLRPVPLLFALATALPSVHDVRAVTSWAPGAESSIEDVERVSARIDAMTPAHQPVISHWPGFFVSTQSRVFPGMENQFAFPAAVDVGSERSRKYHLVDRDRLFFTLLHDALLVVMLDRAFEDVLQQTYGYALAEVIGKTGLYVKARP